MQGVQEQTHAEITRLRVARDDALKAAHESQLDAKDIEVRAETWKAAVSCVHLLVLSMSHRPCRVKANKSELTVSVVLCERTLPWLTFPIIPQDQTSS